MISGEPALIGPRTFSKCSVTFAGSARQFSDRMLSALATEFPDVDFARIERVGSVEQHCRRDAGQRPVLLVIDEEDIDDLLERPDHYVALAEPGRLVVGYRDARAASVLLSAIEMQPGLLRIGFLPLNVQIDAWISITRLLMCGEIVYPQDLLPERFRSAPTDAAAIDGDLLTPREWEILELVATGMQNKLIARDLSVSEHTVKLHVHNILRKLGVPNRTGAAQWYAKCVAASGRGARRE